MNQSLESIIQSQAQSNKRYNQRKKRTPQREQDVDMWQHDQFEPKQNTKQKLIQDQDGYLVKVSNLHWKVSQLDLEELFGDVVSIKLHFDNSGRSEGNATIIFKTKSDAELAYKNFHNQILDGNKLQIELIREWKLKSKQDIVNRLGKSKGIMNRLGDKVDTNIDQRLGKRIQDRLGKKIHERLGIRVEDRLGKKKIKKNKKLNEMDVDKITDRPLTSYVDNDQVHEGGDLIH
ncbi:hypothetical protein BC833DRAFT_602499 [Globomyces pollinis-pini]|nr:hypothetical protein BC833DRAFT_602499 [Globomyces pollinis-pini]KAJ2992627.1 hypothetical protein HDV02_002961 [Globomyces sp. JEL0801]